MALNVATLKTRSLTAVVFVAVMLSGLLWNYWSFLILFTIVQFGCWLEYLKLIEKIYDAIIDNIIKWLFAISGFILMIELGMQQYSDIFINIASFKISIKILTWFFVLLCLVITVFKSKEIPQKAKWAGFLGFIYISLPLTMLLSLRDLLIDININSHIIPLGMIITCAIIFSIWINDTMAYIVGSLIGKTPFSKISPKKTWEGTIGGAILCVLVIGLLGYFVPVAKGVAVKHWIVIAALCAIFGTIGDLFESKLKRMANVKDSGAIMPGHGGFLDRFDSLLLAAPAVWVYVKFFVAG